MPASGLSIHLLVPGLLGPMPGLGDQQTSSGWPRLERFLSRSRISPCGGNDLESTLFSLFEVEAPEGQTLPTAAYSRLGDGASPDDRYWLQASPVYLRADQDRLLLFDVQDLKFTQAEAEDLAGLFNTHFAEQGWRVEVLSPERWYLAFDQAPQIFTHELTEVFGRNIDPYLPKGPEGKQWCVILNEIQMLFFTAAVNTKREMQGKVPISGLWFSGGGYARDRLKPLFSAVVGNHPLMVGLARRAALPVGPLPSDPRQLSSREGRLLLLYDRLQRPVLLADPYDWMDALSGFESWLDVLVDQVSRCRIDEIRLYPCNGQYYRIEKRDLWRFWRRSQPMKDWLDANPIYAD